MKQLNLTKYKNLKKERGSEFWEIWKLILSNFPDLQFNEKERMIWLTRISRSSMTYYQLEQVIEKMNGLDKKYSKIGFLINQFKKHKKPKEYEYTLFGRVEKKKKRKKR